MAAQGKQAFDTKDVIAPNSHAQLLFRAAQGVSDLELALEFGVSLPTVRKWRQLPIGYAPAKRGRQKQDGPAC